MFRYALKSYARTDIWDLRSRNNNNNNSNLCVYPQEAYKAMLYSIALLLRLQQVATPLAIWEHAFFSTCPSPVGLFHAQEPLWFHVNSRVLVDDQN